MDYPSGIRHNVDFRAPTSTHGARTGSQEERARPGRREVARKRVGEKTNKHGKGFIINVLMDVNSDSVSREIIEKK